MPGQGRVVPEPHMSLVVQGPVAEIEPAFALLMFYKLRLATSCGGSGDESRPHPRYTCPILYWCAKNFGRVLCAGGNRGSQGMLRCHFANNEWSAADARLLARLLTRLLARLLAQFWRSDGARGDGFTSVEHARRGTRSPCEVTSPAPRGRFGQAASWACSIVAASVEPQ